jgi:hypothetical protein
MLMDRLVEKCKSVADWLTTLAKLVDETRSAVVEFNKLLHNKVVSMNSVPFEIKVPIEPRVFREVVPYPLRCEETDLNISEIVLDRYNLILQGESRARAVTIDLETVTLKSLLTLACNLEENDLNAVIETMREKSRVMSEDISKLKELVAYTKLVLS